MDASYDIVLIGNGISSRIIASYIPKHFKVLCLSEDQLFPISSMAAGALVSTYGARKGISDLGDIIVDSFDHFENWFKANSFAGIEKIKIQYLNFKDDNSEQFKNRWRHLKIIEKDLYLEVFDNAFLISTEEYLNSLTNSHVQHLSDIVASIDKKNSSLYLNCGKKINYKKLVIATGAYDHLLNEFYKDGSIGSQKISYGAYLVSSGEDLGTNPFALNFNGLNIVYHSSQDLTIGATTQNDHNYVPDLGYLKKSLELIGPAFHKLNRPIPKLTNIHIKSGLRSKGPKRLPTMKWISEDIFVCTHLYKNGFLFSPLAAKIFAENI